MKSRWILLLLLVIGLSSCDGLKTKLGELIKSSLPEAKPVAAPADAKPKAAPVAPGGENVRPLSGAEFEAFVATPDQLVMVVFYTDSCGACSQLSPVLDGLVGESNGKILLGRVNVEQNQGLVVQRGVSSIPDVRFYKHGKEVDRFAGPMPAPLIREKIDKHLAGLGTPAPPVAPTPPAVAPVQDQAKPPATPATGPAANTPPPPPQPKPLTTPMSKDWMPPGIKRR